MLLGSFWAEAQDFQTGYFLGGYQYAYRMNPAFQSERGFFSLGLGNSGLATNSDMGFSDFFYSKNGKTMLFLNDKVTSEEFLGNINKNGNNLNLGLNLNVLAMGFWSGNNFMTIDVNLKSNNSIMLPYDLFRFLKDGASGSSTTFDLGGTGLKSKNYGEIAVGFSRNINNFINFGVRVKGLVGLLEADIQYQSLQMTLNRDKWNFKGQGQAFISQPMVQVTNDASGNWDYNNIGKWFNTQNIGIAGFGGALDAGVSVNILPWITASASILDLGGIRWNREASGKTDEAGYTWDPRSGEAIDVMGGSGSSSGMDDELDQIKDAFKHIYQLKNAGAGEPVFEMLPFRVNLGLEVRLPVYQRLSLGALYSLRNGEGFDLQEGRISLNWTPLDFISLSGSTTINNIFKSYGAALNLHPGLLNLIVGVDMIPAKVVNISPLLSGVPDAAKSFLKIPTGDLNMNGYIGLSLAFGRAKVDYRRRTRD